MRHIASVKGPLSECFEGCMRVVMAVARADVAEQAEERIWLRVHQAANINDAQPQDVLKCAAPLRTALWQSWQSVGVHCVLASSLAGSICAA